MALVRPPRSLALQTLAVLSCHCAQGREVCLLRSATSRCTHSACRLRLAPSRRFHCVCAKRFCCPLLSVKVCVCGSTRAVPCRQLDVVRRAGHGRVLLHHAWAIVDREQARELTVEDPNEDFCTVRLACCSPTPALTLARLQLRDTVDLERVGLCEPTLGAVPIVAELQRVCGLPLQRRGCAA